MDTSYSRLRTIAADASFLATVAYAYRRVRYSDVNPDTTLGELLDRVESRHGLAGEATHDAVVLHLLISRARNPACIHISPNVGQTADRMCSYLSRTEHFLMQVFEGGEYAPVADNGTIPADRRQAEGAALLG